MFKTNKVESEIVYLVKYFEKLLYSVLKSSILEKYQLNAHFSK